MILLEASVVKHQDAWIVAGCFVIISCLMTAYQMAMHIKYNVKPVTRRLVIRIILMVPFYAIDSWLGLRFKHIALYFDLLRECYEAFVIYSFYQLLVDFLGGEEQLVHILRGKKPHPHAFPFCCLPTWRMADYLVQPFQRHTEQTQTNTNDPTAVLKENQLGPKSSATTTSILAIPLLEQEDAESSESEQGRGSYQPPTVEKESSAEPSSPSHHETALPQSDKTSAPVIEVLPLDASTTTAAASSSSSESTTSTAVVAVGAVAVGGVVAENGADVAVFPSSGSFHEFYGAHSDFLIHTQLGTLQYCVCKPVVALIAFILNLLDVYGESSFDFETGYPYLAFITNMSQIWAMYNLLLFYVVCKEDLIPLKPIPKFLCVKAVVFFTFWQSVLIAILASFDVLTSTTHYSKEELTVALQDFIICIEMAIAAIAHHYAFSYKDFHNPELPTVRPTGKLILSSILDVANVSDVFVHDVKRVKKKALGRAKHAKSTKTYKYIQQAPPAAPPTSNTTIVTDSVSSKV